MQETIPTIHPTGIYATDDLCAMLDVSPATLSEARRSGALRSTRKGRRIIYLGEWVLAWLAADADAERKQHVNKSEGRRDG
jgi:hypothetical protein